MSSVESSEVWRQIDSADYLFLGSLFEPRDNALTIVLEEAIANEAKRSSITTIGHLTLPGESRPIEPTEDCLVFTLHWKNYVSYCVTEEMVGSCGKYEDEDYSGRLLRIYVKSHFLDFVAKDTGAHFYLYQHYKIACQNHNIDVVSSVPPELKAMTRQDAQNLTRHSA